MFLTAGPVDVGAEVVPVGVPVNCIVDAPVDVEIFEELELDT